MPERLAFVGVLRAKSLDKIMQLINNYIKYLIYGEVSDFLILRFAGM